MKLFKKKQKSIKNEENNVIINNICKTNMNTTECSLVAQIHELKDKKKSLEFELNELTRVSIPFAIKGITSKQFLNYCDSLCNNFYRYKKNDDIVNLSYMQLHMSNDSLIELSDKIREIAEYNKRPAYIKNEIYKITQQINKLKSELGID